MPVLHSWNIFFIVIFGCVQFQCDFWKDGLCTCDLNTNFFWRPLTRQISTALSPSIDILESRSLTRWWAGSNIHNSSNEWFSPCWIGFDNVIHWKRPATVTLCTSGGIQYISAVSARVPRIKYNLGDASKLKDLTTVWFRKYKIVFASTIQITPDNMLKVASCGHKWALQCVLCIFLCCIFLLRILLCCSCVLS